MGPTDLHSSDHSSSDERTPSVPLQPGDIEFELGIPIPGKILPQDQWAKTAIHRIPPGPFDFESLFQRIAPVVLDIGCGNGRFVVSSAVRRPDVDHIGIDLLPVVIRYATRRGKQRGLSNTRFAVCGGFEFLKEHVSPGTLSEIHIYHPQPFHDPRERHLRLLTPPFLKLVHQSLAPSGRLFLQTDSQAYWDYLVPCVSGLMDWNEQEGPWSEDPNGRSRRELIAAEKGFKILRGYGVRRNELTDAEVDDLVAQMPMPTFRTQTKRRPSKRRRR